MTPHPCPPLTEAQRVGMTRADYEQAVIRRVEHLCDGDDALTRRALRILTQRGNLATWDEADVVDAATRAHAGEDVEVDKLNAHRAAQIDAARDRAAGNRPQRFILDERRLDDPAPAYTGTTPEEYARRGDAHAAALSGGLSASEVLEAALVRYQRDPLAHMRAELAVRIVDTKAGQQATDPADYRTLIRAGAVVALELTTRGLDQGPALDQPTTVLNDELRAAGAPDPARLASNLLAALERNGLTVVPR